MTQPTLEGTVLVENGPCLADRLPAPALRPAPLYGEQSREVCRDVLGLDEDVVDDLIGRGVPDEPIDANKIG